MTKKTVQIKMPEAAHTDLKKFADTTGFSLSDIVKFGITLVKWVIEKQREGYDIYAVPTRNQEKTGEKVKLMLPVN